MDNFTVITTYYNEDDQLPRFLNEFKLLQTKYPATNLIVVDDGSEMFPITMFEDELKSIPNIEVYIVSEDLGFNSHGTRNLAMTKTKTDWNLLMDVDIRLDVGNVDSMLEAAVDGKPCFVNLEQDVSNHVFIQKDIFFSCGGYDEEFTGIHYGDKVFLHYLKNKFGCTYPKKSFRYVRPGRKIKHTDAFNKTTYDNELCILWAPKSKPLTAELTKFVKDRYATEDFSQKKILTFDWYRYI